MLGGWNTHAICMEYVWNMMEYVWNMYGICLEYVWDRYGICMGQACVDASGMTERLFGMTGG